MAGKPTVDSPVNKSRVCHLTMQCLWRSTFSICHPENWFEFSAFFFSCSVKSEVVVFIVTNIVTKLTLYKGRSEKMEKKYIYIYSICFLRLWGKRVQKNTKEKMLRTSALPFHNDLFSNAKDYLRKDYAT